MAGCNYRLLRHPSQLQHNTCEYAEVLKNLNSMPSRFPFSDHVIFADFAGDG